MQTTGRRANVQIMVGHNLGRPPRIDLIPLDRQHVIRKRGSKDEIFLGGTGLETGVIRTEFFGQLGGRNAALWCGSQSPMVGTHQSTDSLHGS